MAVKRAVKMHIFTALTGLIPLMPERVSGAENVYFRILVRNFCITLSMIS